MGFGQKVKNWFITEEDEMDDVYNESTYGHENDNVMSDADMGIKKQRKSGALASIVTKRPESYNEIYEAADYLKKNYPVILDLNRNTPDVINNVMDFLGGVVYAIDGMIVDISPNTYMFLPNGIDVESNEDNKVSYLYADNSHQQQQSEAQNFDATKQYQRSELNPNSAKAVRPTASPKITEGVVKLK